MSHLLLDLRVVPLPFRNKSAPIQKITEETSASTGRTKVGIMANPKYPASCTLAQVQKQCMYYQGDNALFNNLRFSQEYGHISEKMLGKIDKC